VIEFGAPYEVPQKLVATYLKDKKQAISTLLAQIEKVYWGLYWNNLNRKCILLK